MIASSWMMYRKELLRELRLLMNIYDVTLLEAENILLSRSLFINIEYPRPRDTPTRERISKITRSLVLSVDKPNTADSDCNFNPPLVRFQIPS